MARSWLRVASVVFLTIAVLFIVAVAAEVLIADQLRPRNEFGYILLTVVLAGLSGGLLLELMGARIVNG